MLFSEVYGSYFHVVACILEKAVQGNLTERDINNIVSEKAFGESILTIPDCLKNGNWKLLDANMETPLLAAPSMPLTSLQKQWLKTLISDPRIRLFNPSDEGLEDAEPLYGRNIIECFDRYSDGDDFENPEYIRNFQVILEALKQNKKLRMKYTGKQWREKEFICSPVNLEYSSKDDKFRLKAIAYKKMFTLNLSKIECCELTEFMNNDNSEEYTAEKETLIFHLTDERNALERVMFHFSHLEKKAERIDDKHYRIILTYDKDDETEILIRILSFGPMIKVISPEGFIMKLKQRIYNQENCGV